MPKFLRVERDIDVIFINVQDIRWIKQTQDGYELVYSLPGCPTSNKVAVSNAELSASLWTLEQIASRQ